MPDLPDIFNVNMSRPTTTLVSGRDGHLRNARRDLPNFYDAINKLVDGSPLAFKLGYMFVGRTLVKHQESRGVDMPKLDVGVVMQSLMSGELLI